MLFARYLGQTNEFFTTGEIYLVVGTRTNQFSKKYTLLNLSGKVGSFPARDFYIINIPVGRVNHGFPTSLKTALDEAPQEKWDGVVNEWIEANAYLYRL